MFQYIWILFLPTKKLTHIVCVLFKQSRWSRYCPGFFFVGRRLLLGQLLLLHLQYVPNYDSDDEGIQVRGEEECLIII